VLTDRRHKVVKPAVVDRLLVVLNVTLVATVAVVAFMPGGTLRHQIEQFRADRQAKRLLSDEWLLITSGAAVLAGDSTNITVVLFSDYECPFCRATYPSLSAVRSKPLGAGIALRHLVSSSHPNAHRAAAAAICAAAQQRFAAMDEILFTARLDSLSLEWGKAASAAGVSDVVAFLRCMADPSTTSRITADSALGVALGIRGTPTFVTKAGTFPGMKSEVELLTLLGAAIASP